MKIFFVVVAVYVAVVTAELTPEQKQKLQEHSKACSAQSGVDLDLVKKAKQGVFDDDTKLKEYLLCMLKRIGVISEDGKVVREVLVAKTGAVLGDRGLAEKLADECGKDEPEPIETSWKLVRCYHDRAPDHINPVL